MIGEELYRRGVRLYEGTDVKKDEKAGISYIEKAAEHANVQAIRFLFGLYIAEKYKAKNTENKIIAYFEILCNCVDMFEERDGWFLDIYMMALHKSALSFKEYEELAAFLKERQELLSTCGLMGAKGGQFYHFFYNILLESKAVRDKKSANEYLKQAYRLGCMLTSIECARIGVGDGFMCQSDDPLLLRDMFLHSKLIPNIKNVSICAECKEMPLAADLLQLELENSRAISGKLRKAIKEGTLTRKAGIAYYPYLQLCMKLDDKGTYYTHGFAVNLFDTPIRADSRFDNKIAVREICEADKGVTCLYSPELMINQINALKIELTRARDSVVAAWRQAADSNIDSGGESGYYSMALMNWTSWTHGEVPLEITVVLAPVYIFEFGDGELKCFVSGATDDLQIGEPNELIKARIRALKTLKNARV